MDPSEGISEIVRDVGCALKKKEGPAKRKRKVLEKKDSRGESFSDATDNTTDTPITREPFDLGENTLMTPKVLTVDLTLISPDVVQKAIDHIRSWEYVVNEPGTDDEGQPEHRTSPDVPTVPGSTTTNVSIWTFHEDAPGEFVATVEELTQKVTVLPPPEKVTQKVTQ
jgi:hypothetical protein